VGIPRDQRPPGLTAVCRGFFGRGDMQKEFEEAAFKLNKGEVSTMVDTASGVHLIQRSDPLDNHAWPQRLTFV
jgi:hypothetical protein